MPNIKIHFPSQFESRDLIKLAAKRSKMTNIDISNPYEFEVQCVHKHGC